MHQPTRSRSLATSVRLALYAQQNRSRPTESEARLWSALRGGQLGVWFRRQVPVGGSFIADFLAARTRLVVEVDGGYHAARRNADARRDAKLARLGYRVVRTPARLVVEDLAAAVEMVRRAL